MLCSPAGARLGPAKPSRQWLWCPAMGLRSHAHAHARAACPGLAFSGIAWCLGTELTCARAPALCTHRARHRIGPSLCRAQPSERVLAQTLHPPDAAEGHRPRRPAARLPEPGTPHHSKLPAQPVLGRFLARAAVQDKPRWRLHVAEGARVLQACRQAARPGASLLPPTQRIRPTGSALCLFSCGRCCVPPCDAAACCADPGARCAEPRGECRVINGLKLQGTSYKDARVRLCTLPAGAPVGMLHTACGGAACHAPLRPALLRAICAACPLAAIWHGPSMHELRAGLAALTRPPEP